MGQIWMRKITAFDPETGDKMDALVCAGDSAEFDKLKINEDHMIQIKRVRSPAHHRKYFALLKLCFENQEEIEDAENFRKIFQMRCGLVDIVETKTGRAFLPRSISFDKMDQTQFEDLWRKALDQAWESLGMSEDEIRLNLSDFF